MNIEAYTLDSLRKLVRDLQKENKELRLLLEKPSSENPATGNPLTEKPLPDNPTQRNTKEANTDELNIDSFLSRKQAGKKEWMEMEQYRELLRENVGYEYLNT